MNDTMRKMGYPKTVVAEYDKWVVTIRQKQVTAACLVLVCKEVAQAIPEISLEAFAELKGVCRDMENTLQRIVAFEKINYLALIMVDKEVHFHIIPRHSAPRTIGGTVFQDPGWPRPPDLNATNDLNEVQFEDLLTALRAGWSRS
jgi:diadenosine tetraphosphate (Ap4A) HIT family hydrolase